jgi:hypothetical protein
MRYSSLLAIVSGANFVAAAPAHLSERGKPGWPGGYHGHGGSGEPAAVARRRAAAVKEAFEFAWDGYYKYVVKSKQYGMTLTSISQICLSK